MPQTKTKSLLNIAQAGLNPAKAKVIAAKIGRRLFDARGQLTPAQNNDWLETQSVPLENFIQSFEACLLRECQEFDKALNDQAAQILSKIPYDLGGGGGVPLLYLLTRLRKPKIIVETGVAAGFSSATFLSALKMNGGGHLYSSDFPYFRLPNPEQYVGVVVPGDLKQNWSLYLKGDDANIPLILSQTDKIDLFHYDSDKSYNGRAKTLARVKPHLSRDALIIMDDIQDNGFFHDYVQKHSELPFKIFSYQKKYIGLLGKI